MATAERTKVERTVEVDGVTLVLNDEEAQALRDVLGWVGGDPAATRRGLTDNILSALRRAGFAARTVNLDFVPGTEGIYFDEKS